MVRIFNLKDLKDVQEEIAEQLKQDKISFRINGREEYIFVTSDDYYINYIKDNAENINRIYLNFEGFKDRYKDIDFKELQILENTDIDIKIYYDRGFYEDSIKDFNESKIKIHKIIEEITHKDQTEEEKVITVIQWIVDNIAYSEKYNVKEFDEEAKKVLKNRLLISYILKNKETNCAGFANIFFAFLELLDIECNKEKNKWHAWNSFKTKDNSTNGKVYVDLTSLVTRKKEEDKEKKQKVEDKDGNDEKKTIIDKNNYYVKTEKINNFGLYTGNIYDTYEEK